MEFKGKAKEDFEQWFRKQWRDHSERVCINPYYFDYLPFSMQYGVYVDWLESVKDITSLDPVEYEQSLFIGGHSRSVSREETVKKGGERYNQNKEQ